jgi:hypothetical protein
MIFPVLVVVVFVVLLLYFALAGKKKPRVKIWVNIKKAPYGAFSLFIERFGLSSEERCNNRQHLLLCKRFVERFRGSGGADVLSVDIHDLHIGLCGYFFPIVDRLYGVSGNTAFLAGNPRLHVSNHQGTRPITAHVPQVCGMAGFHGMDPQGGL